MFSSDYIAKTSSTTTDYWWWYEYTKEPTTTATTTNATVNKSTKRRALTETSDSEKVNRNSTRVHSRTESYELTRKSLEFAEEKISSGSPLKESTSTLTIPEVPTPQKSSRITETLIRRSSTEKTASVTSKNSGTNHISTYEQLVRTSTRNKSNIRIFHTSVLSFISYSLLVWFETVEIWMQI